MRAIYFYRVLTTFLLSLVFASTAAANNEYYQGENYFVTMVSKEVWDQQGTLATRRCELLNGEDYLDERIIEWIEGESFKVEIYDTNLPLHRNVVKFSVESTDNGSVVTVAPDYSLKYGPLGWLMDRIVARQLFKGGMEDLLSGLKYHVETGEVVGDRIPGMATAVV